MGPSIREWIIILSQMNEPVDRVYKKESESCLNGTEWKMIIDVMYDWFFIYNAEFWFHCFNVL